MTLTVELSQDIGARLREKAARNGQEVAEYLVTLAEEDVENFEDVPWPVLSAAEETDAMIAGVRAGLADVEAGRTMTLEDYKAEVQARRRARDSQKLVAQAETAP